MHGGALTDNAMVYVGSDRRHAARPPLRAVRGADFILVALVVFVVGMALPTVLDRAVSDRALTDVTNALRTVWAMLFLAAGMLRLVRWKVTGEARVAFAGCAILTFALLAGPTALLAVVVNGTDAEVALAPVSRVVAASATLWLLSRMIRSPQVDARIRPLRTLAVVLAAGWGLFAFVAIASHGGVPVSLGRTTWFALEFALAVGWVLCGLKVAAKARRGFDASLVWTAIALVIMTAAELTRGLAFVTDERLALYSTALQLVAGGIALANAAADLNVVLSAEGSEMLSLSAMLRRHERFLEEASIHDQIRRHDARSVMTALKATSLTLDRYGERIDSETKRRLRSSVVSEVDRLAQLLDEQRRESLDEFRLDEALAPLVAAARRAGLDVTATFDAVAAYGRRLEVVAVVRDVLANARMHAPGSPVSLRSTRFADGKVAILVQDQGPGIRVVDRESVFLRSRGRSDRGPKDRTLGMFLSRELMREQGGDIEIRRGLGGGATFVISLPAGQADKP